MDVICAIFLFGFGEFPHVKEQTLEKFLSIISATRSKMSHLRVVSPVVRVTRVA